jgi:ABC-type Fe2+-enterobactin transport system substrate-binding protein
MEHIPFPCEPVELSKLELDAVAGGNPFGINISGLGSNIFAALTLIIDNHPTTIVDNSIHIGGPLIAISGPFVALDL